MKLKPVGALVALAVLAGGTAHAQISPFSDGFELSQGDLDAIGEAMNPLLNDSDKRPGAAAGWSNPDTGASGVIDYLKALTIRGYRCKRMQFDIEFEQYDQLHRYVIDYCEVEPGVWKSYP